jgi:hypothetical protein
MLNIVQWPPFNPRIRDPHKNKDAKGEVSLSAIAVRRLWKKLYPLRARASSVFCLFFLRVFYVFVSFENIDAKGGISVIS